MDFYFLLISLFFPRLTLLAYFLMERFPQSTIPVWGELILGIFIPRILILIFIHQNMGTDNIWFAAHLIALILAYFTGGHRTVKWRNGRRVSE